MFCFFLQFSLSWRKKKKDFKIENTQMATSSTDIKERNSTKIILMVPISTLPDLPWFMRESKK